MKREGKKKINLQKKGKMKQQELEEEKERVRNKKERIKKEARKTMLRLVMEGRRPFYYGL